MKTPRPTILVVDDDQWFLDYALSVLAAAGFGVELARDGFAAINRLDDVAIDSLFLDVFLPVVNGIALLHELHSHTKWAELPVVLVTSAVESLPADMTAYGIAHQLDKTTMTPQKLVAVARRATGYAIE